MRSKWSILPYLFILPNVTLYVVFIFIPILWVLYLSFTDFSILNAGEWAGLKNYARMFRDEAFTKAIVNTFIFWVCTVVPTMAFGLIIANLLNLKIRAVSLFRGSIYLPGVISSVAVAMTWLWLYDPIGGPINGMLEKIGLTGRNWLHDPSVALMSIIMVSIWAGIGFCMIIYLAGLQGIPDHLYEAARLDGATGFKQFVMITFPLLKPITFFIFITTTIRSFQVFDLVYILTSGGPANKTTTIVNEIIKNGFGEYNMGYAATQGIFLLLITFIITMINYYFTSSSSDFD